QGVVTGDIDNDGYREIFVTTLVGTSNVFFRNNGNGTFTDRSSASGLNAGTAWSTSAIFGDYNLDGYLDLYVGNYIASGGIILDSLGNAIGYSHTCGGNVLWKNNRNGTFTNVTSITSLNDVGCALSAVFTDFDGDHDPDILLANDFGEWVKPSALYQNNHPQPFTNISVPSNMDAEMYGMGIAVGDYDHDSDLDYYVTNIGANALFQNQGDGTFEDVALSTGVINDSIDGFMTTSWGAAFIDIDNDGWQDLFCANGWIPLIDVLKNAQEDPDQMWKNNGDGTFSNITLDANLGDTNVGRGMSMADYDQDGDMDIFVNVTQKTTPSEERSVLYKNELSDDNHYLQVKLQGSHSNRDAFGSQMIISVNGERWLHEVSGGSSHLSQNSSIAHFGLGSSTTVDSLYVIWPDGNTQMFTDLEGDRLITIVEDSLPVSLARIRGEKIDARAWPNPFSHSVQIEFERSGQVDLQVRIIDVLGKEVYRFPESQIEVGANRLLWDGRSDQGVEVAAGFYFIEMMGDGEHGVLRIVKL
ncbi:MAG: hypothetical protein DRI69_07490, partial [Bacteroidetes bacterium]